MSVVYITLLAEFALAGRGDGGGVVGGGGRVVVPGGCGERRRGGGGGGEADLLFEILKQ